MDQIVALDFDRDVAFIRLSRSITNPINLDLVRGLSKAISVVRQDASAHGLVLASANDKFFSIGFDIPELFALAREDFVEFFNAFNRACLDLYTLPKPSAAAITGHATAGGCILALCCDYRYIAQGRKFIGLNEIKLGVPVPYVADCILRQLIGQRKAREMMETGEFYSPEAAVRFGLVDEVLLLEEVVPEAIKNVSGIGAFPDKAFAAIKRNRTAPVVQQVEEGFTEKDQEFVDCWYSLEARERLKEAMNKF
jgi:Delta3-Delta2-enoyl-CoA isomerase